VTVIFHLAQLELRVLNATRPMARGVHWKDLNMRRLCACAVLAISLVSCRTVPTAPLPGRDATPPTIRLGSAGLRKDFLLTETSANAETRRAKLSEDVLVVATAEDSESGVQDVTLSVTVSRTCGTAGTNQTFSFTSPTVPDAAPYPVRRSADYTIRPSVLRGGCTQVPSSASVSISAIAVNGIGRQSVTPTATVASYGPDRLRLATFNMYQPGNHPDSVYERWGRELASRADIAILTEVPDSRRASLVGINAGMPNVLFMSGGDVAVISRGPLHDAQQQVIDPPGNPSSNNSNVFRVIAALAGYPHPIIGNHWGIRDANDVLFGPNQNAPGRLEAAQAVLDFAAAAGTSDVVLVGGDLNAFAGSGPQDHDNDGNTPDWIGSTAEMNLLKASLLDPYVYLGAGGPHCSNKRIDFILIRGAYIPTTYEACFGEATPSDHPFVLVTLEAGDR